MEREVFVSTALKYLDYPSILYQGADCGFTTDGFDCSGLVKCVLSDCEYPGFIYRHCNEFFDAFGIFIHEQFRLAGDLVFFSNKSKGRQPDHMGIMIDRDRYVHSPGKDGKRSVLPNLRKKSLCPKMAALSRFFSKTRSALSALP